ncbi:hypothetical protein ABFT80_19810 [Mesorhizobium sp. SB112]|uniref:hypothetical protein n=1 Tax=Mesorhizobium sp. SB112 TaxID=3151853 RepID=UPI00326705DD
MRKLGLICLLLASSSLCAAQEIDSTSEAAQYEKYMAQRTPISALDMSTPQNSAMTFINANIRSDYFTAYFLLSPDAKEGFLKTAQDDQTRLFPGAGSGAIPGSKFAEVSSDHADLLADIRNDAVLVFDDLMLSAEQNRMLPFTFGPGAAVTAIDHTNGKARLEIATGSDPHMILMEMVQLSNGQWRIDRIGWNDSSQTARPWGMD